MSITISSATPDEMDALTQGLLWLVNERYSGKWWSTSSTAAATLLAQLQAKNIADNGKPKHPKDV